MRTDNIHVLNHSIKNGNEVELLIFDVGAGKVFKQKFKIETPE